MKRILLSGLLLVFPLLAFSAEYSIDPNHSSAQFTVRHLMVSNVKGAFSKVTGTINYDPSNLAASSVDATIDVSTVDTRQPMRDADLRSPNFFDVAQVSNDHVQEQEVLSRGKPGKSEGRSDDARSHERSGARCRWPVARSQRSVGEPAHWEPAPRRRSTGTTGD